ncbi:MAG: DoxX family protein [Thermoanaerobaculia bacterium]
MKTAFVLGRLIVGFFYLFAGLNLFLQRSTAAGFAASHDVPLPELAVPVAAAFLLIGGASLLLGWKPAVGIAAIVLFFAPVTFYMHPFWKEAGPERLNDSMNFLKNLALLGSALMFTAIPRPWTASVASSGKRETEIVEPLPARERRRSAG